MRGLRLTTVAISLFALSGCTQQSPVPPSGPSPKAPHADEKSPLVGKPAPDIEQELLDGSHFSLNEQNGKSVVVLDFWATWCGPCVMEMPVVAKVADEYRDKGVALYCVNQREDADTIRSFLEENKSMVTVCLDPQGEAGDAYGADAIPLLVIVDKAGVVRNVHLGYSPDIGDTLKAELDALLAGTDTAAGTSDAATAQEPDDQ
jgi:thiol-disulfide isomerase/thioredoxin